jgi:hypothetical protein
MPKRLSFVSLGKLPPEKASEPFNLRELVRLASVKYEKPVDKFWRMTVADLLLTLRPVEEKQLKTLAQFQALDERIQLIASLNINERIELEKFKNTYCW